MKKIALCSLLLGMYGFSATSVFADGCTPQYCNGRGDDCINAYSFVVDPPTIDEQETYVCERGFCDPGTVLFNPDLDKAVICTASSFLGSWNNTWKDYTSNIKWCTDEQIRMWKGMDVHSKYVLKIGNTLPAFSKKTLVNAIAPHSHVKADTTKNLVFAGNNVCFAYACEYGYEASADLKTCKPEGAQDVVERREGECGSDEERATKNISVISSCTGSNCTPIVAGQCYNKKYLACMTAIDEKLETKITWNGQDCVCTDDKKELNYESKKCVAKGAPGSKQTCAQLYAGYPERIACCEAGSATKWTGTVSNGKCECVDTTKKWENKQCVAKQESETGNCKYKFKSTITCANGQYMSVDKETMVEAADCDEFNRLYGADLNKAMEIFGDLCAGVSPVYVPVHVNVDPIAFQNASDKLKSFAASAKGEASGWKTADGKFNTTRLASDLTAGVVLGTVGGVVSGVVIKKKQVEKGFDALHCTVGGQKIADWGDEFSVGLQR